MDGPAGSLRSRPQLPLQVFVIPLYLNPINFILLVQVENEDVITTEAQSFIGNIRKVFGLGAADQHLAAHQSLGIRHGGMDRIFDIGKTVNQTGPDCFAQFADLAATGFAERFEPDFAVGIAKVHHLIHVVSCVGMDKIDAGAFQHALCSGALRWVLHGFQVFDRYKDKSVRRRSIVILRHYT